MYYEEVTKSSDSDGVYVDHEARPDWRDLAAVECSVGE